MGRFQAFEVLQQALPAACGLVTQVGVGGMDRSGSLHLKCCSRRYLQRVGWFDRGKGMDKTGV